MMDRRREMWMNTGNDDWTTPCTGIQVPNALLKKDD